jgi:hypothetical protein
VVLDRYARIRFDDERMQVTVESGCRLAIRATRTAAAGRSLLRGSMRRLVPDLVASRADRRRFLQHRLQAARPGTRSRTRSSYPFHRRRAVHDVRRR